jgi:hypothetical protein
MASGAAGGDVRAALAAGDALDATASRGRLRCDGAAAGRLRQHAGMWFEVGRSVEALSSLPFTPIVQGEVLQHTVY